MDNKKITDNSNGPEYKYHGLRNAIIKQAVVDLRKTLKRFFKEPNKYKDELNNIYRYFVVHHCYAMISFDTAEYIYFETVKDIESKYTEEEIKKAREIFKYYYE